MERRPHKNGACLRAGKDRECGDRAMRAIQALSVRLTALAVVLIAFLTPAAPAAWRLVAASIETAATQAVRSKLVLNIPNSHLVI